MPPNRCWSLLNCFSICRSSRLIAARIFIQSSAEECISSRTPSQMGQKVGACVTCGEREDQRPLSQPLPV
jgi:hypothetical protein